MPTNLHNGSQQAEKSILKQAMLISGTFVGLLWLIKLVQIIFAFNFSIMGILPRSLQGLLGILTAPLVHGDVFLFFNDGQVSHLASNTIPVFILMASLFYFYRKIALKSMLGIWILTGLWVWVGARGNSVHIGASGILYGLAAFLFFSGMFRRDVKSLTISLAVGFLYGGLVWGVLPTQEFISWESHLFGGISGILMAWFFRKEQVFFRKKYYWEEEPESDPRDPYAVWNYKYQVSPMPDEELRRIREGIGEDEN